MTTRLHLVPRSIMRGVIPPLPQYAFMATLGDKFLCVSPHWLLRYTATTPHYSGTAKRESFSSLNSLIGWKEITNRRCSISQFWTLVNVVIELRCINEFLSLCTVYNHLSLKDTNKTPPPQLRASSFVPTMSTCSRFTTVTPSSGYAKQFGYVNTRTENFSLLRFFRTFSNKVFHLGFLYHKTKFHLRAGRSGF